MSKVFSLSSASPNADNRESVRRAIFCLNEVVKALMAWEQGAVAAAASQTQNQLASDATLADVITQANNARADMAAVKTQVSEIRACLLGLGFITG